MGSKKKTKIYRFSPVIYPFTLWISCPEELVDASKYFRCLENDSENKAKWENGNAYTSPIIYNKRTKDIGIMIMFNPEKDVSIGTIATIAHESTHAARLIWEHMGEGCTGVEADAYLVGWIASCCDKALRDNFEKNEGTTD